MRFKGFFVFVAALLLTGANLQAAETFQIDSSHSTIGFKVRHLGISYVTGKFDKFEGQLMFEGDQLTSLKGTADTTTINTADSKRDGHLKSDDFFAADKFPTLIFESTKITRTEGILSVVGNLTMRDVTKVIVLQGQMGGFANMGPVRKTGLVLEGDINRQDFGLKFNKALETGQLMVGDQVKISLELEANMQTTAPAEMKSTAEIKSTAKEEVKK